MRSGIGRSRRARRTSGWGQALLAALTLGVTAADARAQERKVDHAPFTALLGRHVVQGMVDYDAFREAPAFAAYLRALDTASPAGMSEPDRLAFWINVYNAYTIALINQKGERESIRNINKTLGFIKAKGPWSDPIVRAGGRRLTLDDVEHRIIRKEFDEPRIHFALVCAAMGCPVLRSEAYTGAALDAQLEDQSRRFILESPTKNRVDVERATVHHSMIFRYYKEDFGGSDAAIGAYLARFHPPGAKRQLLESGRFRLVETAYDWTLNSQQQARRLNLLP